MNLYLRLFLLLFRLIGLPRKGLLEESRVAFRVLPNDCDVNLHMNNGRYLSFMDLGRVHLVAQVGLMPRHRRASAGGRRSARPRSTSSARSRRSRSSSW